MDKVFRIQTPPSCSHEVRACSVASGQKSHGVEFPPNHGQDSAVNHGDSSCFYSIRNLGEKIFIEAVDFLTWLVAV